MKNNEKTTKYSQWICRICFFAVFFCVLSGTAISGRVYAADETAEKSTPELKVVIDVGEDEVFSAGYSLKQLSGLPLTRQSYTSMDAASYPEIISAKGILLSDISSTFGIDSNDLENITFSSADGWKRTYTKAFLFDTPRYRYPALKANAVKAADGSVAIAAEAENGKTVIDAMLAISTYEARLADAEDYTKLSTKDGLRICFGQSEPGENCSQFYGKHINQVEIKLKADSAFSAADIAKKLIAPAETSMIVDEESGKEANKLPDTLTVKVGYFGESYTVKKTFSLAELNAMPQVRQAYTYIDNMPAVVTETAQGVKLKDILSAAGIDLNSVESLYFYCMDVDSTWYECLTKRYLLDTRRYYYPNLASHWDRDTQSAKAGAATGAVPVDTIIASVDSWKRFAAEPDFSSMNDQSRFRLVFGQTDLVSPNAYRSAMWIYGIEVMLGGSSAGTAADADKQTKAVVGSLFDPNAGQKGNVYEVSAKDISKVQISNPKADGAGSQKWRIYEMNEDAQAYKTVAPDHSLNRYVAAIGILLLLFGAAREYRYYRKETTTR